jgi:hypothetical protein
VTCRRDYGSVPTDVTFYDDQGDLVSTVALDS